MRDKLLILSVFIVASCGLAYELIAGALASYLLGDSILQFSSIIGCYLFAMGVGSHLSKYVKDERTLDTFIEIELLVGLIGGLSATVLFLVFAWAAAPFRSVLYALVFATGVLVGLEIPLVMRVLNQRQNDFAEIVSRVLTFDYLGALAVSLIFPLVLAPHLGLARSALLFGLINVGIALMTTKIFRAQLAQPSLQLMRGGVALFVLLGAMFSADHLTRWSEKTLYGDEIIHAQTTPYQRLLITQWKNDTRLYINGNLQFSSRDEYRYHEALVHPVLEKLPQAKSVLVLGGGDGLAVREILKYPNIEHITLVDLDPAMTGLFTHNERLTGFNQHSLSNLKVKVINADAAQWIEQNQNVFDAIIIDFPDPSNFALGKLYSVPMYRLVKKHLSENGLMVVQSTSPLHAPRSYWCIDQTLKEVGLYTTPYHAFVPSFGEWGFILASKQPGYTPPSSYRVKTKFLDAETTRQMFFFPPDMQPVKVEANQLNNQSLVHYFEQDWSQVIR
ncbi:polyamine aminopropyltransferase [Chitinibacter bivalviorum]|uniref:Polyamine aminopropyltransferase n=1 Tax=Chitinibacter bivalviorum TaxID=2739434 RepID=A0A7H9BIS9_9NEIS|nr:polyamine aminopropyltransferase [Chitinibacter bivalviorum]QLG88148.1 polyamine aminopropyltransferase [Chitinibacter bivalviorum]